MQTIKSVLKSTPLRLRIAAVRAALAGAAVIAVGAAPAHAAGQTEREPIDKRAGVVTVSVTNLTHATWLAPILVAAHPVGFSAFMEGKAASAELQAIAEIGDIEPLSQALPAGAATVLNPAGGALKPGATVTTRQFSAGRGTANGRLSVLAMLVPTNDGFVGLNAIDIPKEPGRYVYMLTAYDAGTEANNEAQASTPGVGQPGLGLPPFLNGADGNPSADIYPNAPGFENAKAEGFVHVHRGIVGGPAGGLSALEQSSYRWLNPVARVVLTVR